jgi:tetratricopeptide (TPR) repeat protein
MHAWLLAATLSLSVPAPMPAPEAAARQAQVMAVPPALEAQMRAVVLAGSPSPSTRLERLARFVFDPKTGLGITYDEQATSSVAEAYATRKANCLTFTLLFVALARDAGLHAYPQEIGETLDWRESGGTIFRDNHVNAGVRVDGEPLTVDVAGADVLGLRPPARISDRRLLSHYYNNLAIRQLELGYYDAAASDMDAALSLDPTYAPHWSNAGVVALHAGDFDGAHQAFLQALVLDPDESGALLNLVELAHRRGDAREEADWRARLAEVQQRDPLQHFMEALDYERIGNYAQAIAQFQHAIRLHPGDHRFYAALARACIEASDRRCARNALQQARHYSEGPLRAQYDGLLSDLREGEAIR